MDLNLTGKVAVVSGASKGLGFAIAKTLSSEGAKVAICARTLETLEGAATSIIDATGGEVYWHVADVSKPEEGARFVQEAAERLGSVEILVNNAGGPPSTTFLEATDEMWQAGFELNFKSAVSMTRAAVPFMQAKGWGRVINVTSVSVKQPIPGLILSNAIRAGLIGMAKTLSDELAPLGILVNNVCPGYTATERLQELAQGIADSKGTSVQRVLEQWKEMIPLGRIGDPEELANLVTFLASERASYITGATIQVDGGRYRGLM